MDITKIMFEEWLVQVVMFMYNKAKTVVKTNHGMSEKFEKKTDVHQGSGLSLFLLVPVMEALTN